MIQIEDYPYSIDEHGDVYRHGSSKPLAQVIHKDTGYLMVSLWKDNKPTTRYVHILVATYFVYNPEPSEKLWVNHIDGNKQNPHKSNLEWTTRSENMLHAYRIGLCSQAHKKVLTDDQARAAVGTILDGSTLTSLAKALNVGVTTLHHYVLKAAEDIGASEKLQNEYTRQKAERNRRNSSKQSVKVIQCGLDGEAIQVFESLREAARKLELSSGNISNCLKGRAKTCGGYVWKYM